MKTYKGDTRLVVVIGPLAFKFARINPWKAVLRFCVILISIIKYQPSRIIYYLNKVCHYTDEMIDSPQKLLLRGIAANWRERQFYKEHRLAILMPTYFSLFGLVNIQKSGVSPRMHHTDFWNCIRIIAEDDKILYVDGHTFDNSDNFAQVNDRLLILDYGSTGCREFLLKWGDKIYDKFDFSFNWEEYDRLNNPKTDQQTTTETAGDNQ